MENVQLEKDTFNFWMPVEIEKAGKKEDGSKDYSNMKMKGIASPNDGSDDLDGEVLEPEGFDLSYLNSRGFINWHHQSKNDPSAIIGEPLRSSITPKGLLVEAHLYEDSDVARKAYDTQEMLQKNSKTRRLGWSIEGKVLEKVGNRIKKAKITGVALTHSPKNANTFAEVCKAMSDGTTTEKILSNQDSGEYGTFNIITANGSTIGIVGGIVNYVEKAMETDGTGEPLKKESLEKNEKVTTHSKLMLRIFNKYPGISFQKANQIYEKVKNNINKQ